MSMDVLESIIFVTIVVLLAGVAIMLCRMVYTGANHMCRPHHIVACRVTDRVYHKPYSTTMITYANNVPVPLITHHNERHEVYACDQFGESFSCDVTKEFWESTKIGDEVSLAYTVGRFDGSKRPVSFCERLCS